MIALLPAMLPPPDEIETVLATVSGELDDAKKLLELGIVSPTLVKQVYKKLALKYLSDARQEIKNQVVDEIDRMQDPAQA